MAQSGNGVDIGVVYQRLTVVAEKVAAHDGRFEAIDRKLTVVADKLAVHDGRFEAIDRKLGDMSADLSGLREAVTNYHASVLGHGILISEPDERARRIERHLRLAPAGK